MRNRLIILFVALLALQAEAKTSNFMRLLQDLGFWMPAENSCPQDPESVAPMSAEMLWARAERARSDQDYCDAAKFYKEYIRQYPDGANYKLAWRELVITYNQSQNYILAMNEANVYIDDNKGMNDSEFMHYQLMRAVYLKIINETHHAQIKQEFASYALGANITQSDETPYLQNMKFKTYLDRYPNSYFKKEVEANLNEIRQIYGAFILKEARQLAARREYPQAINKYMMITGWGPVLDMFHEALYELTVLNVDFAWGLLDSHRVLDFRLAGYLRQNPDTVYTLEQRKKLSDDTWKQALQVLQQMKENIPDSPWTKKAEKYVKEMGEPQKF